MRERICIFMFFLLGGSFYLNAQTIFWTETFQNGCAASCNANAYFGPNGGWTITDNSPLLDGCGYATSPNTWYVSGAECGNSVGICGSTCGATDPSLHIGSTTMGDMGASFDAGGWCDFGMGGWGSGTTTDKRCLSPGINCAGFTGITLKFNYIENGQGANDDASLWFFDGSVWALLVNTAKTSTAGCAGQGKWTAFSTLLPAAANNNSNIKIGFRWVNNDDGVGTDPSFAVDDITLSYNALLPIELIDFSLHPNQEKIDIDWSTASETNNEFFAIERSLDDINYFAIAIIDGAGNSNTVLNYTVTDFFPAKGISYYRIKQTDYDGNYTFSGVKSINFSEKKARFSFINSDLENNLINISINNPLSSAFSVEIINVLGHQIIKKSFLEPNINGIIPINMGEAIRGFYILRISNGTEEYIKKFSY
ncbi:MAG: T9SS type A sorting domain-containing protein [Bacteroidetes bacterium]|nr:T9SS type A sorting domain-containing protein [Bacteroidota bacterium]